MRRKIRQNESVQPDVNIQPAAESVPEINPVLNVLIWLVAIYATVLGVKLLLRTKGDSKRLGIGLLIAVAGWTCIEMGCEFVASIKIQNADGPATLAVPLMRTVMELGLLTTGISLALLVLSNISFTLTGGDLIRLQKAALRLGLSVLGLFIIYQVHFAGQYSVKTLVLSVGGALVFVIGLGLQRTLTNLFSGFDLQADHVFQKGDMVQIGLNGPEGVVWDTSLRSTRVHTLDGQMLIVANGELLVKEVINLDHPTRTLRVRRTISIAYSVPPMRAKDVMIQVLKHDVAVLHDPEPLVLVTQYGESGITYELRFWVADRRTLDETVDGVLTQIWYALRESRIEIPYPVRTVRMTDMKADAEHALANEERVREIERFVAQCPLFDESHMSSAERRELARNALEIELKAGELAVRHGEQSDHMFIIRRGTVRVQAPGKEPVEIHAPHWFGEMALLLNQPRSADVSACEGGVTLLRFGKASVLSVLKRRPEFAKELRQVSEERRIASGIAEAVAPERTLRRRLRVVGRRVAHSLRPW